METVIENNLAPLYTKLAKVMGQITRLAKTGVNTHFNYKFATEADVSDTVRGLLAEQNVAFLVNMLDVKQEDDTTRATFSFTFACGDTGATISSMWQAEAQDKGDKGINKVATAAVKYFLLKTFLISTGDPKDDPDSASGVSEKKKARETATAFVQAWRSKDVTDADMLAALKVDKLSAWDWSDGDKTANECVLAWVEAQKATPPAQAQGFAPKNGVIPGQGKVIETPLNGKHNRLTPTREADTVPDETPLQPSNDPKGYKLDTQGRRNDFRSWVWTEFQMRVSDFAPAFKTNAVDLDVELAKVSRSEAEEIVREFNRNEQAKADKLAEKEAL